MDWANKVIINGESFDEFRENKYNPNETYTAIKLTLGRNDGRVEQDNYGYLSRKNSPENDFNKGIRRDKTHYSTLSNDDNFEDWRRQTVATVHAHKLENVIDQNYTPLTKGDQRLLQDQNTFLYDVFVSKILTPMGQHYVRQYEDTRDARSVWTSYLGYMKTSTRAEKHKVMRLRFQTPLHLFCSIDILTGACMI